MKVTGEQAVELLLSGHHVKFEREYEFNTATKHRFDFAIIYGSVKIGIEVEGGTFGRPVVCDNCHQPVKRRTRSGHVYQVREGGRHNTGKGMSEDYRKYNLAECLGWHVLHYTTDMLDKNPGQVLNDVLLLIKGE